MREMRDAIEGKFAALRAVRGGTAPDRSAFVAAAHRERPS